ncbi:MAG: N-acetylmuramoyl-L-alanine amidase [Actinomycetota bacterium]|nr:N-acetylmuramoyl-L-alanine amidase [Actinomycetota bacterium]
MRIEHPARLREARTNAMDRRSFLRLGGAGLAGAVLLGTVSRGGAGALAQTGSSLDAEFGAAAKEYGVPKEILLAVGYVNTLWEMPPPDASPYEPDELHGRGAYGIMQLVRRPSKDTLGRAASLTGLSEKKLKANRAANVRGGAAVLADMAGGDKPSDLDGWYDVVAEYGSGGLYANEVYGALERGASAKISTGERLKLAPQSGAEPRALVRAAGTADYPGADWYGNNGRNYSNRNRGAAAIDMIVVHVAQGTYSGTLGWFRNPDNRGSSAHYTVSKYGAVGQSVRDEDVAWHAGWWATNKRSIGIEHAGYVGNPSWFTTDMYHASAKLSAWLSRRYGIPADRNHIIGHHEVPGCSGAGGGVSCHTDPGRYWDWSRYMRLVRYYK